MTFKTATPLVFCLLASALLSPIAHADEDSSAGSFSSDRFKVDGFGSLGVARSTNGEAEILRSLTPPEGITDDWSAKNDSILGLQASYRISDEIETVAQAVSYLRDDGSFQPNITWAFLKYDVTPRFSMRFGRIGTEFLMLADSRLVGYSYLPVRPANEFYGIIPINYGDGIDARLRWPVGDGMLRLEGFAGIAAEDTARYSFSGAKILKGTIGYDQGNWLFRYINTWTKLANEFDGIDQLRGALTLAGSATTADKLGFKDTVSIYQSLGAAYDDGAWQVQGAINYVGHEAETMKNSRGIFFQVARRVGNVTPFVSYARAKSLHKTLDTGLSAFNPYAPMLNGAVTHAIQMSNVDSQTLSLGARWDVRRNVDLKAQVDFVRAGEGSNLLLLNAPPDSDYKATVFSLSLDFVF